MSSATTVSASANDDWKDLVVDLLPPPGSWTEDAYLWLTDHTSRLVELNDGHLEVPPAPTDRHQSILQALFLAFFQHLDPRGGKVQFAPLRLRIRDGKIREPDLLLVADANDPRRQNRFWTGADLVLEILSPDSPRRDLEDKRLDYANAGVPEYWIVDPDRETITVLALRQGRYIELRQIARGQHATSHILPDFTVPVDRVFDVS